MNAFLLLLGLAVVVDEWQPRHAVAVAPDGLTEVEGGLGKSVVVAKLRTIKLEKGAHAGGERNRGFHCSGGWDPCSPVLELELEIDGKNVWVPTSVYADLADVSSAELRQTGEYVTLWLQCGDAAGSYSVRITFDDERVMRRQIIAAFGTNEVAEETVYHELTPLD